MQTDLMKYICALGKLNIIFGFVFFVLICADVVNCLSSYREKMMRCVTD